MAKRTGDLILRDRLECTFDGGGQRTTLYGRFDLSEYVSVVNRKGFKIKEIHFQPRLGYSPWSNTGAWNPGLQNLTDIQASAFKLWACTTAYESAADVGVASPGVVALEEWVSLGYNSGGAQGNGHQFSHTVYTPTDLHTDGYITVTDLLIGVAADDCSGLVDATIEIDVLLVGEPVSVTAADMTMMLAQGQDQ
jgi:hypothetical protein